MWHSLLQWQNSWTGTVYAIGLYEVVFCFCKKARYIWQSWVEEKEATNLDSLHCGYIGFSMCHASRETKHVFFATEQGNRQ